VGTKLYAATVVAPDVLTHKYELELPQDDSRTLKVFWLDRVVDGQTMAHKLCIAVSLEEGHDITGRPAMTDVKMPEPDSYTNYPAFDVPCYSAEQMKQYGDDHAREMLEMAASIANDEPQEQSGDGTYVCTPYTIARAIRALKEQIK
jgi:hypothetical protein